MERRGNLSVVFEVVRDDVVRQGYRRRRRRSRGRAREGPLGRQPRTPRRPRRRGWAPSSRQRGEEGPGPARDRPLKKAH